MPSLEKLVKLFLAVSLVALAADLRAATKLLPDEQNNVDVYKRCHPSVVNITTVTLRYDFFMDVVPQQGLGSGAIIRNDGYILTNQHVIGRAQDVQVTLHDKTVHKAKLVGVDADSDLAVLKIDAKRPLQALEFHEGDLAVGQKVLAIGNPFGFGGSLSVGIISALGRDIRATTNRLIKNVIQTDAAINPGNSGGPLLDSAGKMIGVNAQIFTQSGGSEGIGFAISMETVKKVVPQLIQFGEVLRPDVGFAGVGLPAALLQELGAPLERGVMITQLKPKGPAAKAGLKSHSRELIWRFQRIPVDGDIVFQVDGQPVGSLSDVLDVVADKKVNDKVTIHYWRRGQKRTATIRLGVPSRFRGETI